jgi:hypothetical protein
LVIILINHQKSLGIFGTPEGEAELAKVKKEIEEERASFENQKQSLKRTIR